eukprot:CAMPEP_0184648070 /NCGR_PEP_ID=MMETSP0308-20130426/5148_1 /TAXON_ID=38269 /ORGANISM="Gloeochaete witrockiana, Strain SAG 46.84" /LENGTH=118 /DNA_ID=CAMNT_0027079615 /DNA_START=93 /DNA_END=452 /DNA_ORIENTATION=+
MTVTEYEVLQPLLFLFPNVLQSAVDVLENERIVKIVAHTSRRSVFQVEGRSDRPYICFDDAFGGYCSCDSFRYTVLTQRTAICCKHQLAVRIAKSLKSFDVLQVSDGDFPKFLLVDNS